MTRSAKYGPNRGSGSNDQYRTNWRGWLRSQHTHEANLMLRIGGESQNHTLVNIERQHVRGDTDEAGYQHRIAAHRRMAFGYLGRNESFTAADHTDWTRLAPGCYQHKTHLFDSTLADVGVYEDAVAV